MPVIMPNKKKRQSSKSRISVDVTNRNRVTIKSGKLTIARTNGIQSSKLRDRAEGYDDASECLADDVVLLPAGKQTASVECQLQHLKTLRRVARKHSIELTAKSTCPKSGIIVVDVSGTPDNTRDFANHVAGHSDLVGVKVIIVTSPMESTGTDSHVSDAIRNGHTLPPKRIDYSAGRNQPKATYPINGHSSANDIDHVDTRNDDKRAGLFAPQIPHTEH